MKESNNALRHLIDDEHLANAQAEQTQEESSLQNPAEHENQQIRFKANQYGSFAANDHQPVADGSQ